jgi:hypothetical protein
VSETSNTTHPVTQHINPEDWGDKCTGAHILWRTYARYNVCESRGEEHFGVAIQFKPFCSRVHLKPDGTWWRTGGEVKGKLVNGVGSQYSHTTWEHGVFSITTADAQTSAASSWLNWRPADLNGLVRFGKKWNLVSARAPSHFKHSLTISVVPMSRHMIKMLLRLDCGQAMRHGYTILLLGQNKLVCILGCWSNAWEVADWTIIRKWKWLFVNGYKC